MNGVVDIKQPYMMSSSRDEPARDAFQTHGVCKVGVGGQRSRSVDHGEAWPHGA